MSNYEIASIIWALIGLVTFFVLLFITAPYGRHKIKGWGIDISNRLAWFFMEALCPLFISYWFWSGTSQKTTLNVTLYLLYVFHYIYRGCIFPFLTRTKNKTMPVSIMLMAVFFNLMNTFFIGYQLGYLGGRESISIFELIFGLLLFVSGFIIHVISDRILFNLRKPNETGYKIPHGFLFNYISSPNYFGELMEWVGFAILFGAPAGWLFVFWTAVNLVPRAISNHKWYKQNFSDYPEKRKVIVPKLF